MLPETLVALRTLAGLTQTGLSSALGVSRSTIARWENGKAPIPKWVELLAAALAECIAQALEAEKSPD